MNKVFSMSVFLLLAALLLFGCTSSRPQSQGINCGNTGEQINECMYNAGRTCTAAFGEMQMDGIQGYAQIKGIENNQCHVFAEATQNGLSASMNCLLPRASNGEFLDFVGNERVKQYCTGVLADLIESQMENQAQ